MTYTLVVETHAEVDAWHSFLLSRSGVRVTAPGSSSKFGCYAFNFYDVNNSTGLGCYRFEVQP